MGIGRREFIKLSSLALAGLTFNPLQAVITNQNFYINRKLGILFFKPASWHFISIKDFGEVKSKQILTNEIDINDLYNDIDDYPICLITKYSPTNEKYKKIFSPTISVTVTPKSDYEEYSIYTLEELFELAIIGAQNIHDEFEIINRPDPYIISGCLFYEFDAEYLFNHVDLEKPIKAELKSIKTEHNNLIYEFDFHQCKAQNQTAEREIKEFIKSINFV